MRKNTTEQELLQLMHDASWRGVAEQLDDILARATKSRWAPAKVLEHAALIERSFKEQRSMQRRLVESKVGRFKPIADFDWNWPQSIDREAIERALSGALVRNSENMILVANQGLGKTMIARNLAYETVQQGQSALFVEASKMLLDLGAQESSRALDRRLRYYARPALLCIDEVGYLSYDARAADLLYDVIARRYNTRSTVITTNLVFKDWPTAFPNASCVAAMIDRLTHRADVVAITGESYRTREAKMRLDQRSKAKRR
jgi:DNA replication protein DnaC